MSDLTEKLVQIQTTLAAPKSQRNAFGNYNYRSCEDILNALKPLLVQTGCSVTLSDEIVEVGGRVYIKAVATLCSGEVSTSVTAYAREPDDKKGMDVSQITGAASSYARKYALNGLFAIDDTKDADTQKPPQTRQSAPKKKPAGRNWAAEFTAANVLQPANMLRDAKTAAQRKEVLDSVVKHEDMTEAGYQLLVEYAESKGGVQ